MEGQLVKLTIKAFTDAKFNRAAGEFVLPINPQEFAENLSLKLNNLQAPGMQGNDPKYDRTEPETVALEFVLDGTGVVPLPDSLKGKTVSEQVVALKQVVYEMEGSIHQPKYLKIIWGDFVFDCKMTALQVTYTLFNPDATPLRAKVKLQLKEFTEPKKRLAEEGKNSPDLTHVRGIQEAEKLPLKTFEMYGDDSLYLEVARVNGLTNFRRIAPGTKIIFPPIIEPSE